MVRIDLAAAGLPYRDEGGRYFDFHATRGQFISMLAAGGVHPKVAQILARHSTIVLTMDAYTHLDVLDVAGALDKLPPLPNGKTSRKARYRRFRFRVCRVLSRLGDVLFGVVLRTRKLRRAAIAVYATSRKLPLCALDAPCRSKWNACPLSEQVKRYLTN